MPGLRAESQEQMAGGTGAREQGKRMKGKSTGRAVKALLVSMAVGLGMTACSRDYTVAYVYATTATATTQGAITAYSVDFQSGALQQLADSPIPSGGSNPITLVASPNGKNLYVLNHDTSTVVQFAIGTDGKLFAQATTNVVQGANGVTGSFPTAAAIDPTGAFLYVAFTYQSGFTTARPGPGGIAVYPINASSGALGTAVSNTSVGGATTANPLPYFPVGMSPVGITASALHNFVYVVEQDTTTTNGVTTNVGNILAFSDGPTTGAPTGVLTPIAGTTTVNATALTGTRAGTTPSAIAEDPSAHFLYVSDQATNQLYGYIVTNGGALQSMSSSPFATGQFPLGVTVDPRGLYVYVANFGDNTLSVYTINQGSGTLSGVAGTSGVKTGPTCVTIEPALGIYLYTSNNEDDSVSAEQLNPHSGALTQVQGTPYTAGHLPTCAVSVANGSHATNLVNAN
jgi:6-phosphogluconolactonase